MFARLSQQTPVDDSSLLPSTSPPVSLSLRRQSAVRTVEQLVASLTELASKELPNGHLFLSSATKPGLKVRSCVLPASARFPLTLYHAQDFSIYGSYRLIRSVSAKLAAETFGAVPAWAAWLERIKELYPVEVFDERDPKE